MRKIWSGTAKRTNLVTAIDNSQRTIGCNDLSGWPVSGPFAAVFDPGTTEEWVLCDSRTGNTLNVNTSGRGYVGSAVSHGANAVVRHAVDFNTIDEANRFVNLMTTKGDLISHDGTLPQRFAAGTVDGQVLKRLAAAATGLEWSHVGTVPPYASAGARTTALPSPVDGQASYLNSGDVSEGIEFWNGASWRPPWNMPWGDAFQPVDSTATQTNLTSATDITATSQTFTAVLRRWLKYNWSLTIEFNTASSQGATTIQLVDGSNTILVEWYILTNANNITAWPHTYDFDILRQESAGSITRKLRTPGNANGVNIGTYSPAIHTQFSCEDVGAVTGTPT